MTATTTPDLDAIERRLHPDNQFYYQDGGLGECIADAADLLTLARAQQQRIAELEAEVAECQKQPEELTCIECHKTWIYEAGGGRLVCPSCLGRAVRVLAP